MTEQVESMKNPKYKASDPYKYKDYRHTEEKPKINNIGQIKRELEFIEGEMQRVKTTLQKLHQDTTLTLSISMLGIRPKQFADQHDHHLMNQAKYRIHMIMIDTLTLIL